MKKVGIITVHCADNFGAMLQAYALKTYITKLGCSTKIIHYCPKRVTKDYPILFYKGEIKAGIKSGLKCLWRSVIYIKFRNLPFSISKKRKMHHFRNVNYNLTKKAKTFDALQTIETFDCYVTGSDQLWNPDITGLDDAYFLKFAPKESRKISYAVSVGKELSKNEQQELLKKIEDFQAVSLREKESITKLQPETSFKLQKCVDPTLLIERAEWEKLIIKPKKERYIVFYSLFYTAEEFDAVNQISELLQCEVLHFFYGRLAKRIKRNGGSFYYYGVEEFLGLIKHAEYIITDSFHGAVFSLLFEKKFGVVLPPVRSMRLRDLLETTGFCNRIIGTDLDTFDWEWSKKQEQYDQLDFTQITQDSKDYLKRELM